MKKHLKDYFVPHEGNSYQPHSLQKAALLGMLCLVVLSFTLANVQSLLWVSSQWMTSAVLPSVIVDMTNQQREDGALSDLQRSPTLDAAATLKAQDMAKHQYFAHYSPKGISPWYWFKQVHYNFVHAGENLAVHFTDSQDVVDAWMHSPAHRANIMDGEFSQIGVGTAEGTYEGFKTIFVVQLFGTPSAVPTRIVSESEGEPMALANPRTDEPQATSSQQRGVLAESASSQQQSKSITQPATSSQTQTVASVSTSSRDMALSSSSVGTSTTYMVGIQHAANDTVLFSDTVATSTGGVPASIDSQDHQHQHTQRVPSYLRLATQPHVLLQALYMVIGVFVFVSLLLSIFIEIRKQQPVQIVYGVAMLVLMYGLFQLHLYISAGALIV